MADNEIPIPFREALDGSPALADDGGPPPDVTPEDDGEDDGNHHHHVRFVHPVVLVLSDGAVQAQSLTGSLVFAWCTLASAVTVYTALAWLWARLDPVTAGTALVIAAATVGLGVFVTLAWEALKWAARRWRAKRGQR